MCFGGKSAEIVRGGGSMRPPDRVRANSSWVCSSSMNQPSSVGSMYIGASGGGISPRVISMMYSGSSSIPNGAAPSVETPSPGSVRKTS
jgi:hypothetical protein